MVHQRCCDVGRVLSLAITGRAACQACVERQLSDTGPGMWFYRGVSTKKVPVEGCAQNFGVSSLISWAGCACDECGSGSGSQNCEPCLRDPIHGFSLLRSKRRPIQNGIHACCPARR
jgi:hypothetical protein